MEGHAECTEETKLTMTNKGNDESNNNDNQNHSEKTINMVWPCQENDGKQTI